MNIFIQSAVSFVGILLAAGLAYHFSQKRYTYEKLFDRKLAYLEEMYSKIVALEKDLRKYIFTTGAETNDESLPKKRNELPIIQAKLLDLQDYFRKKEIVLNNSTITAIQSFLDISIKIYSKLKISLNAQSIGESGVSFDRWDSAYQAMKNSLSSTTEQLKKDFKLVIRHEDK